MQGSRVAVRYARALFSAAEKAGIIDSVASDLDLIGGAMELKPEFATFFGSPDRSRDERLSLCERVFADRVTALTMSALRLLVAKGRETEFSDLRLEFTNLKRERERKVYALVASARPLSEEERRALITKVETATRKTVEADFEVDPTLVGGLTVTYDNYMLDGSVRGRLARLKDHLIYDVLKQI
jgi:F-type H+-transporting ATPase subunit delta